MRILVTGGAGFIGSNFVNMALANHFPEITSIKVIDKLTYAGKMSNLSSAMKHSNFEFVLGDICDSKVVRALVQEADVVINFAAESHVDRSIENSEPFVTTNILGTQVLLDAIKPFKEKRYIQISTDEVYGSISIGSWDENDPLLPNSPYAASKASADLLTRSYFITHGVNALITRCSNNFGPNQDSEKLIPNIIMKLTRGEKVSLYGDGKNVRDWLHVSDHCKGIYQVLIKGEPGEIYNIGGGTELTNLDLTRKLLNHFNKSEASIDFIKDRLGHDKRYSVNFNKLRKLGYEPSSDFDLQLTQTIEHYSGEVIG